MKALASTMADSAAFLIKDGEPADAGGQGPPLRLGQDRL
jgi:hypothetical protein